MDVPTRHGPVACHVSGHGPPLLLLSANPGDHRDWAAIVPDLASGHRVIAVDWPGYGDSAPPSPPAAASAMMFAEVAIDVADALDLSSLVAVGNSVGGYASVRLAVERPARVAGIVLVDSGGFTRHTWLSRAFCRLKGREAVTRVIAGHFARRYLRRRTPYTAEILARTDAGRRVPSVVAVDAAVWRSFLAPGHALFDVAAQVRAPVLLTWGRHDPVVPLRTDGAAAARALGVEPVVFDTGHMPFAEDPAAFLATLRPFLAGVHRRAA
jgi:pimeloyl-ACP methyl ester carboxylesterase